MSWDLLTYEVIKYMTRIDNTKTGREEVKHTVTKVYTL